MSRCFPFPPPGYEKKGRIEDTDSLSKEKHKEKKTKKEKKDKEKREGKEKKDKERSKQKQREKEDRKDKHKGKDDKDRDKEENRTSAGKKVEGLPDFHNGDKFVPNSFQNGETKDFKYMQELSRRINVDDKTTQSQMVQKNVVTDQRRSELPGRVVEASFGNQYKEKEKTMDKKDDWKVNGSRPYVDARGLDYTIDRSLTGMNQKRVEGNMNAIEKKNVEMQMEKKDNSKRGETYVGVRGMEKEVAQNVSRMNWERVEGNFRPMETKIVDKQMEGKEKSRHKENEGKSAKHKDRGSEKKKKSKEKDKVKEKEKKEKDKVKEKEKKENMKSEPSNEQPKFKGSSKDSLDTSISEPLQLPEESTKSNAGEGTLGKRKELQINGFLHDNGIWPNKLPRPVSSAQPVIGNGRNLEPCQTATGFEFGRQGAANTPLVEIKEHKINGLIEVQQTSVCSTRPLSSTVQFNENGDTPEKQPHPDSKYLRQILSVPKMEEWSDSYDHEWLFSSTSQRSEKPKEGSPGVGSTPQVWAEALRIEDADVYALPYVIPY